MTNRSIEKLIAKTTTTPTPTISKLRFTFTRFLQLGSSHEETKNLQVFLNSLGFAIASKGPGSPGDETDFFGSLTSNALKKFQAAYGIEQVGFVGPRTRAKLNELSSGEKPAETSGNLLKLIGPFAFGYQNDQVKLLQTMLAKDPSVYPEAKVTGYYGNLTKKAVERFQQKYGIEQTGIAGPQTRTKLNEVYGQ